MAMVAALRPTTPPPRITTRPRRVPGTPPSSTPLPPRSFSRQRRADLHGHAAGDLAHRAQQRKRAVVELDGLVGDAGHLRLDELARELRLGREVQVRVEDQARRGRSRYSAASGSLTFTTMSRAPGVGRRCGTIVAPAST